LRKIFRKEESCNSGAKHLKSVTGMSEGKNARLSRCVKNLGVDYKRVEEGLRHTPLPGDYI